MENYKPQTNEIPAQINLLKQQAMAMGANDYENTAFDKILIKLNTGGYTDPNDALEEALKIIQNKQDYH